MATIFKARKSGPYYAKFRDEFGVWRNRSTKCRDKQAARAAAMALEQRAERIRVGLRTTHDDQLARPIAAHLDEFEKHLANKRNTDEHNRRLMNFLRTAVDECSWHKLSDIQPTRLIAHFDAIRIKDDCLSARAYNARLGAWRHFTRWLVRQQRLPTDPLSTLSNLSLASDVRIERRALDPQELQVLLDATRNGPTRYGMTGEDRYALYLTVLGTGLRRGELDSLTAKSIDFEATPPVVVVEAAYSKHRRRDVQPITSDAAAELRDWMRTKLPDAPLWPKFPRSTALMLKDDLNTAGIDFVDESGRRFDFHALRGQYITGLSRAGVHPRKAQQLARHGSIELTMRSYTHLTLSDLAGSLENVRALPPDAKEAVAAWTGTDDCPVRLEEPSATKGATKPQSPEA